MRRANAGPNVTRQLPRVDDPAPTTSGVNEEFTEPRNLAGDATSKATSNSAGAANLRAQFVGDLARAVLSTERMFNTLRTAVFGLTLFGAAAAAEAQAITVGVQRPEPESRWSVDFGIGWDKGISGNINSGAIGVLNGQTTVVLKQQYEDVYGTGLHIRFGGGYMLRDDVEVRGTFTFQSLDADLVQLGDFGAANLYGQYDDYQSWALDIGLRQYTRLHELFTGYGEATIGLGFVDETDVLLSAPAVGFTGTATDFYDRTAAFTLGVNFGVMYEARPKVDVWAQVGLRYVTGMTEVDNLEGTGLETINDKSARWSLPLTLGVRYRF